MRILCGAILAVAALSAHGAFDVRDFGAKGDGVAKDTASIQSAIDNLKELNKGTDIQAIKDGIDAVQKAFYAVSEKLYQQANPQGGQPNYGGNPGDDNVVDADYETVD